MHHGQIISLPGLQKDAPAKVNLRHEEPVALDEVYPVINTDAQHRYVVRAAWDVLRTANSPPRVFRRHGALVCLNPADNHGTAQLRTLSKRRLCRLLVEAADWKNGDKASSPPSNVLDMMLDDPDPGLPELETVTTIPVLTPSLRIMNTPGYDAAERIYFNDIHGLSTPVWGTPNLHEARDRLLDTIQDFPFVSNADRSHAIAAILLPFVRPAIQDGCSPLHLVESCCPGSGKGLFADLVAIIATGEPTRPVTLSHSAEENARTLAAILAEGNTIIHLDNWTLERTLNDATLASFLTSTQPGSRRLGSSRMMPLRNSATWILSCNNPKLTHEISRRCVRIRIDPQTDRPWLRSGFRHAHLRRWAEDNRKELVGACVDIIRGWVAAGGPSWRGGPLGSFEQWSALMGGILEFAGFEGFLGNIEDLYDRVDPESREWRSLTLLWWERFGATPVKTSDLHVLCREHDLLDELIGHGNTTSRLSRLGRALNRNADRVFGAFKISIDNSVTRSSARYSLRQILGITRSAL